MQPSLWEQLQQGLVPAHQLEAEAGFGHKGGGTVRPAVPGAADDKHGPG